MQSRLWLVVGLLVLAAIGILTVDLMDHRRALALSSAPLDSITTTTSIVKSPTATPLSAQGIASQRAELDRTVWAKEVTAQDYEDTFIALWDGMRSRQDDQYRLLAAFPFAA